MSADDDLEGEFPSLRGRGPKRLVAAMTALGPVGLAWLPYAKALVTQGRLRPALRELVVLRVAWHHQSEYVWGGHVLMAKGEGLELAPTTALTADDEELVVEIVDELLVSGRLQDGTRALAIRQFAPEELLELVMVIGQYQMLSLVGEVLRFPAEPDCPKLPPTWPGPGPSDDGR